MTVVGESVLGKSLSVSGHDRGRSVLLGERVKVLFKYCGHDFDILGPES